MRLLLLNPLTAIDNSPFSLLMDPAFAASGFTPATTPAFVDSYGQDTLTGILIYHVARGRRTSSEVVASEQIRTLPRGLLDVEFVLTM